VLQEVSTTTSERATARQEHCRRGTGAREDAY
jgi:hypothetical protein